MAKGPKYVVKFRREREGKTNYKKRLALLKSRLSRLVVRISNKNIICQAIAHGKEGDAVLAVGTSNELAKLGWKGSKSNIPAAYLTGYLCGKKALKAKVDEAVFDLGFRDVVKSSKVFATLKGALDAGLQIPHDDVILPPQDRIEGAHIDAKVKAQVDDLRKKIDSKFSK